MAGVIVAIKWLGILIGIWLYMRLADWDVNR